MEGWSEVRRKIECNSPDITKLGLGFPDPFSSLRLKFYLPGIDEWEALGRHIGRNTHLKELVLDCSNGSPEAREETIEGMDKLFHGIAGNRSIQSLHINFKNSRLNRELFLTLIPFFKRNTNFDCLHIDGDTTFEDLSRLTSALMEFDGLKDFSLSFPSQRGPTDYLPANLIQALIGHPCLTKIHLRCCKVDGNGCIALRTLLQNPNTTIRALKFDWCHIDDGGVLDDLARSMAGCSTLKHLELVQVSGFSGANWQTLFSALQNSACSLDHLWIDNSGNTLPEAIASLSSALNSHKDLKFLNLRAFCQNVGEVTPLLGFLHSNSVSRLKELNLSHNQFNSENINNLTNSLSNNHTLRRLGLARILNPENVPSGWRALSAGFSAIFRNQNLALEHLNLWFNHFYFGATDEILISFATSLENNSTLKELFLGGDFFSPDYESNVTSDGWVALSRVLCDTSSIMGTYHSNHTLQTISHEQGSDLPNFAENIMPLLKANEESKDQAARLKIIMTHFREGFNKDPFVGMTLKLLPHAIAWMGKGGRSMAVDGHLYGFVKVTMVGRGLFGRDSENQERKRD